MGSAAKSSRSSASSTRLTTRKRTRRRYVICLSNDGFKASLEVRKVYVAIPEPRSEQRGLMRVVDESGEDYLYPSRLFAEVDLPTTAARVVNDAR